MESLPPNGTFASEAAGSYELVRLGGSALEARPIPTSFPDPILQCDAYHGKPPTGQTRSDASGNWTAAPPRTLRFLDVPSGRGLVAPTELELPPTRALAQAGIVLGSLGSFLIVCFSNLDGSARSFDSKTQVCMWSIANPHIVA